MFRKVRLLTKIRMSGIIHVMEKEKIDFASPAKNNRQAAQALRNKQLMAKSERRTSEKSLDNESEQSEGVFSTKRKIGSAALVAAALVGGGYTINHMNESTEGGYSNLEYLEDKDATIQTIYLESGARLRYDPNVEDGEFTNNLYKEITIKPDTAVIPVETPDGAYLYRQDIANETWYGIPVEDLQVVGYDASKDKDGVVWVSTQRASAERDDSLVSETEEQ